MTGPLIELRSVSKYFGPVVALKDVSMAVSGGEVHCLLGDNGAGKSSLIKVLAGTQSPDAGEILVNGMPTRFASPSDALDKGVAAVYQDLALVPLMSIARNFFLGREPVKRFGPLARLDIRFCNETADKALAGMGIRLRNPEQPVGTLSGGERQCLAIARAVYFGAKVLILDEPTSALGVHQASVVLRLIAQSRARGIGVVFISHNVQHAEIVGDRFTIMKHGRSVGSFSRAEITREQLLGHMAGGRELTDLGEDLAPADGWSAQANRRPRRENGAP